MNNKEKILRLINQMIDKSMSSDKDQKILAAKNPIGPIIQGDSWMTFHLKALKELVENS